MVDCFFGRFNSSGTAVHTMKNAGYPKYQTVELSTPVLTAAHRAFYIFFDILITVIYVLLGSVTGQMQYRFLTAPVFLSFQELMNEIVILLPDLF